MFRLAGLAALLGAATVLGFAPFYLYPLPVLTLAALFLLWQQAPTPRAAALLGYGFGLGFFGAGVSWVYVSMHEFGYMPVPLAGTATLLFCAILALFPAMAGWLQARLDGPRWVRLLLSMPAIWMGLEWVRGWLFTGFPWLVIGYAQAPFGELAGYAPILGVYGISLLMALTAGALVQALGFWRGGAKKAFAGTLAAVTLLWGSGAGLLNVNWTQPAAGPVAVSLVQGNVRQDLKWREEQMRRSLDLYASLADGARGRLVVMPETALPIFYTGTENGYLTLLEGMMRARNADLLVGMPARGQAPREYYNAMVALGTSGTQIYRKLHLVPFGEYVPPLFGFINQLMVIPLSNFSRGSPDQPPLKLAGEKVAVNICYEDVFGEEIIRPLPEATLLINTSNDAWFGDSWAPWQHLQKAQMRALETGRYHLRATNTGVTAIIDEKGRVAAKIPQFEVGVLEGQARGFTGATLYVRWGNGPALGLMLLMLAVGAFLSRRKT
jgi:apolipoprotein N-acyltransferase